MTKKINKVIVYYEDGTYEEIKAGVDNASNKSNTPDVNTSPVTPDLRPDYYKIREYPVPTHVPDPSILPWTITCGTGSVPLHYSFTSTGNFSPDNKYSITSTGNGNVDLSK